MERIKHQTSKIVTETSSVLFISQSLHHRNTIRKSHVMVSQTQGKPLNTHGHPCQELGKPGHGSPPSAEASVRPVSQVLPDRRC